MRLQKIWLNFHVSNKLVSKNYSTKISRSRRFPWWILSVFKDEIILISHKLFQKVEEEGPPKAYGPWWRVLTKCRPLEKGMANYFSILASRTLWTLWEWKKKKKARSYLSLIASSKTLLKKIVNKGSQWICTSEERIFNLVQREGITPQIP